MVWSRWVATQWEDGARAILKPDKQNLMKIKIVCSCSLHPQMPLPYSSAPSAWSRWTAPRSLISGITSLPPSPTNFPRWRWALPRIPANLIFHIKNDFHISFCIFSTMPGSPHDLQKYFIYLGDSLKTRNIEVWGLLNLIALWMGKRRKRLSDSWPARSPKKHVTEGKPENKCWRGWTHSETLPAALRVEKLQRWSCWGYSPPGRESH